MWVINVTRWRLDTCDCVAEYAWDTEAAAEDREHTLTSLIPCVDHTKVNGGVQKQFDAAQNENHTKNKVWAHAVETIPDLTFEVVDPDTGDLIKKQRHQDYEWEFDNNRRLVYAFKRGNAAEHDALDNKLRADPNVKAPVVRGNSAQIAQLRLSKKG
jgi:hypothetical protein